VPSLLMRTCAPTLRRSALIPEEPARIVSAPRTRGSAMRRRDALSLLGGAAVSWPLGARAQQPATPVIGFLGTETPDLFAPRLRAFHQGLSETGFAEGSNVRIEYRWAEGRNDRLPALATDLVRHQVLVIAAGGTPAALAAKAASTAVATVFAVAIDPVAVGLVVSLARPGHNATGVTSLGSEIGPKKLELLHELLPTATNFALLTNPTNSAMAESETRNLLTAARTLGLQLRVLHASTERDFDTVFAALAEGQADALVIGNDLFTAANSSRSSGPQRSRGRLGRVRSKASACGGLGCSTPSPQTIPKDRLVSPRSCRRCSR
jgi:putative tryptophan/tyrosine transport system substrate-binding protein